MGRLIINNFRNQIEQKKGQQAKLVELICNTEDDIYDHESNLKNIEKALTIFQVVAQKTQEELKYHISEIVTLALKSVFDEECEFKINFVIKRGKTEADLLFLMNGKEVKPIDSDGGGAVDVACFALRIALWNLKRPKSMNTIILDEPFKNLDKNAQPKAGQLLKELSNKLGIQFILVTHEKALTEVADRIFTIKKINRISQVIV